jgi:hypothetical protein
MSFVSCHRRYRLSIRTLMLAVALCALLLAPLVWMYRWREAERMAILAVQSARVQAELALNRAQVRTAQAVLKATKADTADPLEMASQPADSQGNLWAALSVNRPAFKPEH